MLGIAAAWAGTALALAALSIGIYNGYSLHKLHELYKTGNMSWSSYPVSLLTNKFSSFVESKPALDPIRRGENLSSTDLAKKLNDKQNDILNNVLDTGHVAPITTNYSADELLYHQTFKDNSDLAAMYKYYEKYSLAIWILSLIAGICCLVYDFNLSTPNYPAVLTSIFASCAAAYVENHMLIHGFGNKADSFIDKYLNSRFKTIYNYMDLTDSNDVSTGLYALYRIFNDGQLDGLGKYITPKATDYNTDESLSLDSDKSDSDPDAWLKLNQDYMNTVNSDAGAALAIGNDAFFGIDNSSIKAYDTAIEHLKKQNKEAMSSKEMDILANVSYLLLNNDTDTIEYNLRRMTIKDRLKFAYDIWKFDKTAVVYIDAVLSANTYDSALYRTSFDSSEQIINLLALSLNDDRVINDLITFSDELNNSRLIALVTNTYDKSDKNSQKVIKIINFMTTVGYKISQIMLKNIKLSLDVAAQNEAEIKSNNRISTNVEGMDDSTLLDHYAQIQKSDLKK